MKYCKMSNMADKESLCFDKSVKCEWKKYVRNNVEQLETDCKATKDVKEIFRIVKKTIK